MTAVYFLTTFIDLRASLLHISMLCTKLFCTSDIKLENVLFSAQVPMSLQSVSCYAPDHPVGFEILSQTSVPPLQGREICYILLDTWPQRSNGQ